MEVTSWEERVVVGDDWAYFGSQQMETGAAERGVFAGKDERGLGPEGGAVFWEHGDEGGQGQSG